MTGKDFGLDPQGWLDWWRTVSYTVPGEIAAGPPVIHVGYLSSANLGTTGVTVSTPWSCFVAGTPVWTRRGPVAIDQVRLGDLAPSRNVETGELAYRPVVNRTVRHRGQTVEIGLNGETIRCTPGHMFRMADQSWRQAKELQPGDAIRSCESTGPVASMSEGTAENVYNLVVAEFNTYFVGHSKLLAHDITPISDLPSDVLQTTDQEE